MAVNLRVVCLTNVVPAITGSGGATAIYGLGASLKYSGFEVHFAVDFRPDHMHSGSDDFPLHFLSGSNGQISTQVFGALLKDLNPDVVWIFNPVYWGVFAPFRKEFPHVLYALDPPWEIEILRQKWRKSAPDLARKFVYHIRHLRKIYGLRRDERLVFRQASEFGLVTGYIQNETIGMSKRTGVIIQVCTLVFPDLGHRSSPSGISTPQALLLGNMNSTHTRYGLNYFFKQVWPYWNNNNNPPRSVIRVVGGGRLPDKIQKPTENDKLKWVGFLPTLDSEWEQATTLLVPVPLKNGIRSRILEAWSRGVPVIAHPAAENGIPEMRTGENYIAANPADEWIEAQKLLENDSNLASQIARNGRDTYERCYSIKTGVQQYTDITQQAIKKFSSKLSA